MIRIDENKGKHTKIHVGRPEFKLDPSSLKSKENVLFRRHREKRKTTEQKDLRFYFDDPRIIHFGGLFHSFLLGLRYFKRICWVKPAVQYYTRSQTSRPALALELI